MRRALVLLIGTVVAAFGVFAGPSVTIATPNSLGVDHDGGLLDVNVGPASVPVGGAVTVSLVAEAPEGGLGSWTIDVHFDPAVIQMSSCVTNPAAAGACGIAFVETNIRLVGASSVGLSGIVKLADITFESSAGPGECSVLDLEVDTWTGPWGGVPTPTVSDGSVCVAVAVSRVGIDHDGGAPDITAGPLDIPAEGTGTIGVVAETLPEGLGAWTVDIHYDPTVIEPVSCTTTAAALGSCDIAVSAAEVRFTGVTLAGLFGTVSLADITFRALAASGRCSGLLPEAVTWEDSDGTGRAVSMINGGACITGPDSQIGIDHNGTPPDINGGPLNLPAGRMGTLGVVTETPPEGLGAWTLDVLYDPSVLQLSDCEGFAGVCVIDPSEGRARLAGATAVGLFGTVDLGEITFRAVGSPGSCTVVALEVVTWTDANRKDRTAKVTNGVICVTEPCADVTGDGQVTGLDVAATARQILRRHYDPRFDMNGDGVVNRFDLLIVVRHLRSTC